MTEEKIKFQEKLAQIEKRHEDNLLMLNKEFKDNFGRAQKVLKFFIFSINEFHK